MRSRILWEPDAKSNVVPTDSSPGIPVLMRRTATSTLSVPIAAHRGLTDEGCLDLYPQGSWGLGLILSIAALS